MGGVCLLLEEGQRTGAKAATNGPPCTSNFQILPFVFDNRRWQSVEQCYQAIKYVCAAPQEIIMQSMPEPGESEHNYGCRMWALGQSGAFQGEECRVRPEFGRINEEDPEIRYKLYKKSEHKKAEWMYQIVGAKYRDNEDARDELMGATGSLYIAGCRSTANWPKWNGLIQMAMRAEIAEAGNDKEKIAKIGTKCGPELIDFLMSFFEPSRFSEGQLRRWA